VTDNELTEEEQAVLNDEALLARLKRDVDRDDLVSRGDFAQYAVGYDDWTRVEHQ
jgi:hypothetical protein